MRLESVCRRPATSMKPLQLAKNYCANFQHDGSCLGAIIDDDLSMRHALPLPRCILGDPIRKCSYFEQCVAPMEQTFKAIFAGPRSEWPKDDRDRAAFPGLVSRVSEAMHEYRIKTGSVFSAKRICPECRERTVEPNKQFCVTCREAKAKEVTRRKNQNRGHKYTES